MSRFSIGLFWAASYLVGADDAVTTSSAIDSLQPARVSCDAAYSAPCARQNSQWLATSVAHSGYDEYLIQLQLTSFFSDVSTGIYNMPTGFYPFIFDRATKLCVAHGADKYLVGLTLTEIFHRNGIGYSDTDALHERFVAAADNGGGWVRYLWSDGGSTNSKLAYVLNVTDRYYLGVGYEDAQLPVDLPSSDKFDSASSITNVRSLVGKAQFHLFEAVSQENFESALFDLSFSEDYKVPDGFYVFMYTYEGILKAHGVLRDSFGHELSQIFQDKELGTKADADSLLEQFITAAEGSGWVQYQWRNSLDEDQYTKIAYIVKVEFDGEEYFVGVGFNFAKHPSMSGPLGAPCSDDYNLVCAFQTAQDLSSHALVYSISSSLQVDQVFYQVATDLQFRSDDFYVFMYSFDGTCVAHGLVPNYIGLTLEEVFDLNRITLDAGSLHQKFVDAAEAGGGFVLYDWLVPGEDGSDFEKISYIFRVNLDGRDYYGGVGFNHKRYPVEVNADAGLKRNGDPVPCSRMYDLTCSEINTQSILGQSLSELVLASSGSRVTEDGVSFATNVKDVLARISSQVTDDFRVNDFYVMVFSAGTNLCSEDDLSGCCVAHGNNTLFVHQTWQQILNYEGITSIQGVDLHHHLLEKARSGGGWVEYPWSKETGEAQTKRALTARYRFNGEVFYVVAEYLTTPQPLTCDACPSDTECTSGEQSYCTEKPEPPLTENPLVITLIVLFSVGTPLVALFFWNQKQRSKARSRQKLNELNKRMEQMAEQMEQQMQGMVEVLKEMPLSNPERYSERIKQGNMGVPGTATRTIWYWEEDASYLESHKASMVLSSSNFVRYASEVSEQIERAYQRWVEGRGYQEYHLNLTNKISSTANGGKVCNANTGLEYDLNFETMTQQNSKSKHQRAIRREEAQMKMDIDVVELPALPEDIDFSDEGEDLLPLIVGQVIQVSKRHPDNEWFFGSVLYDPLLHDASENQNQNSGLNDVLAHALHDRPTSGWFPRALVQDADTNVMHKLLNNLGGEGLEALSAPDHWDLDPKSSTGYKEGRITVRQDSAEYTQVASFFMKALYAQAPNITVEKIERIQNLPLWQSYSVKKQTIKTRDINNPKHRENNLDWNDVERRWLFHGTAPEVVPKIEKQGFNRAFAGRNAVAYGRGVYFARDASYSSHKAFSCPDIRGVQQMFLCCVVVGDWCRGTDGQLTPNPKRHNKLELFDTTVDNITNPSIFVVYHDAQAYPEYLVSFKTRG